MLRRVERSAKSESWILVPQAEHARLAGGLASVWADGALASIDPHAEVIAAITHHDDGWKDWDAIPDVDPETGRPFSFIEMPLATSIDIWRRSIYLACSRGYLAAHMVSAHFTALLQKASTRWSRDSLRFQNSRQFLDDQSDHREIWLAQWQQGQPRVRTRAMADLALGYLQFFDMLSLWFCGAPRSEPQSFATPTGGQILVVPKSDLRFKLEPWPLAENEWHWTVPARSVPAARYASREALATTPSEPVELNFQLTADG